MNSEITVWNPRAPVSIPATVQRAEEIAKYARQLTDREVKQVVNAFAAGDFEMGALFLWQKTMTGLKKQLGSLGMDFVAGLLDRTDITATSAPAHVLTDYEAVHLAEELGMFTSTQAMRLRNVMQLVAHFSGSPGEVEEIGEWQMMPEEAIGCLRTCIQSVLGYENLVGAIGFAKFREDLEDKTFSPDDPEIRDMLESPYFFQRTALRFVIALAKTSEGAQLQHVLDNTNVVVTVLWPYLLKADRWMVGRAYAEVHAEGRKRVAAGLRNVLLKVRGFDYVPEDLRSRTFMQAADDLRNIHFSMNNYYHEPAAIRSLESLGTVIPTPALAKCMTAMLCVRLGNHWGVSFSAVPIAKKILSGLGDARWKYYLDDCLPADQIILEKLTDSAIAPRWTLLVAECALENVEVGNTNVAKLVKGAVKGKTIEVTEAAETLHARLTTV